VSVTAPVTTRPSNWNLPNALTVLRILLVPVMAVLLLHGAGEDPWWRVGALAVFLLAIATDRVDGELARRKDLVTDFGKVADPIADKALIGTALVLLSVLGLLPWWVTVLVLGREIGITLMRFVVIRHGVMPAGRGGKLKTVLQSIALGFFIFPTEIWLDTWVLVIGWVVMLAAVLVTLVTGADYVAQAFRLRRGSDRTAAKQAARQGRA
jgi:CDP-diacylglycerol--glycerol-3-phosphate 3-phosphatidyltransferase